MRLHCRASGLLTPLLAVRQPLRTVLPQPRGVLAEPAQIGVCSKAWASADTLSGHLFQPPFVCLGQLVDAARTPGCLHVRDSCTRSRLRPSARSACS